MLTLLRRYDYTNAYNTNSQGYRCPEFESIDWANSIVVFGCSNTFGIALPNYEDTVTNQLSLLLNCPVINLGQGASGYSYQWINSTILKSHGIVPKAAVYLWPEHSRQCVFYGNDFLLDHRAIGWWSIKPDANLSNIDTALVSDEFHGTAMAHYQSENVRILWDIPVLQYSWAPPAPNKNIKIMSFPIDFAEDGLHPGLETNKIRAAIIANDLQELS